MKYFLTTVCSVALFAAALPAAKAQTIPLYQNFGTVSDNPQIDATAFANYGTFSVSSPLPYDFTNTKYYTNRGTMTATPGFQFDTAFSLGKRQPAATFVNENGGTVQALDSVQIVSQFTDQVVSPSYILISAQNITNHGVLLAGAAGLVQLSGTNVDVSRGGLGISRIEESSTFFASILGGIYFPDPGIYDTHSTGYTNDFLAVGSLLTVSATATNVAAPGTAGFTSFKNPISSVVTNVGGSDPTSGKPTNIFRQAAFVMLGDTNFTATIKWAPSRDPAFHLQSAVVEIKLPDTNVITGDVEFSTLYLLDTLGSTTNYLMLTNQAAFPETYLPATYTLTRLAPAEWLSGSPGKGTLTNTFFFDPKDTNYVPVVTNFYAAYGARIDDLSSEPPNVPLLDPADFPGRVEITAQNLNLNQTRIRGTGLVSIKTPNLLGATNLNVDSENVLLNLAVPNGPLNVQNVLQDHVVRLNGNISVWSAIWTNNLGINVTNTVPDPSGTGTTNVAGVQLVEIDTHVLLVDARQLLATKPVITHDLITQADQTVLGDPIQIVRNLQINSPSLVLNSTLNLNGTFINFGSTNAPNLKTLSIGKAGTLIVPNVANLGADLTAGYTAFTNAGTVTASGLLIHGSTFVSSGVLTSSVDGIVIQSQSAQFQGARTLSANDIQISGSDIRFSTSTNSAVGTLTLNATSSLADSGSGASNFFLVHNGFQLPVKPATGDLLGTTFDTYAPRFALIDHAWAGDDRGASATGFSDNVAIGHLILDGDVQSTLSFRGATGHNGMYVDLLELKGVLTNAFNANSLGSALQVDPSLTIYFSNSNVAADQLQQQSGGRLVHVDFAGPADFVQVPLQSGGTAQMAQAIRNSTTLDSDGDGIPNASDPFPLDPATPLRLSGVRSNGQTSISLTWQAQPQVTYQIEYATDLQSPSWQSLLSFTNTDSVPKTAVVQDQLSENHAQRYYRVRSVQ